MSVPLTSLTETQILQEIRKHFENEALTGINVDELIDTSVTLQELFEIIQQQIDARDSKSLS